jgi:hypothetical protein
LRISTTRFSARLFALGALLILVTGCAQSIKHDESLAARRAVEFAQAAFIDKNFESAYALLSEGGKRHLPFDKFKETVTRMHAHGFPDKVTARESQPMPGENAIWIYLVGRNTEDQFGYRFTMEADGNGDYKVLAFDSGVIGRMFSPLSEKKPLERTFSTH